ncbi:MAG: hypothetical protein HS104_24525 [Polyangiaceae bacterium]|nr:hypothetical protein [Polyangiaceae bacterium]MCL4754255.1 hypothetical protein [Myxococcales bacterium]
MIARWLLFCFALGGCSYQPARFRDRPPVTDARDDRPIAIPRSNAFIEAFYLSDVFLRRPVVDALDAERFPYARDVNALDEVPRSSWFSPIALDGEAFERAYAADGPPKPPARVERRGGSFLLTDARGRAYRLLGDHPGLPATDTAAALIASRLVRAIGYLTPETWLVEPRPLGLSRSDGPDSGRWVAVRWPVGVTLGPTDMTYPRGDDPNDRIPHRDRRTLRALGVLAAWLDLRELGPSRLVDAYVGRPGLGHVRHYVVGLHDALGAAGLAPTHHRVSAVGPVQGAAWKNLLTLGLARPRPSSKPLERTLRVFLPELDPRYELGHPYEPVDRLLASDGYWIAKRLARVPSRTLEASVRAADLSDPELERHLVRALEARRRTLISYWFSRVTPCEVEAVSARTLVLADEALRAGVENADSTHYELRFLGDDGRELSPPRRVPPTLDEVEIALPELERPYFVVSVTVSRRGRPAARAMEVHFYSDQGELRLVGIRH